MYKNRINAAIEAHRDDGSVAVWGRGSLISGHICLKSGAPALRTFFGNQKSVVTVPMENGKYWYITKGVVVNVPIKIAEKLKEMNCIQDYKVI